MVSIVTDVNKEELERQAYISLREAGSMEYGYGVLGEQKVKSGKLSGDISVPRYGHTYIMQTVTTVDDDEHGYAWSMVRMSQQIQKKSRMVSIIILFHFLITKSIFIDRCDPHVQMARKAHSREADRIGRGDLSGQPSASEETKSKMGTKRCISTGAKTAKHRGALQGWPVSIAGLRGYAHRLQSSYEMQASGCAGHFGTGAP